MPGIAWGPSPWFRARMTPEDYARMRGRRWTGFGRWGGPFTVRCDGAVGVGSSPREAIERALAKLEDVA